MDEKRHANDELLAKLDQKMEDHILQNQQEFNMLREQMEPIKRFYERVQWPMQAIAWGLMVLILAILSAIGNWIFDVFKRHAP